MKTKINYLLVFLGCMLIFPLTSNAQCSYERQAELSRIAANVQFSYTYEIENNDSAIPRFIITATNLTNDIYITDLEGNTSINRTEMQMSCYDCQKIAIDIYSNDDACKNEKLLTQYVSLPIYNKFYKKDICVKNRDDEHCALWRNNDVYSLSDFEKLFKNKTNENVNEDNNIATNDFLRIIRQNKGIVVASIVVFMLIIIFVIAIKRRGDNK